MTTYHKQQERIKAKDKIPFGVLKMIAFLALLVVRFCSHFQLENHFLNVLLLHTFQ